MRKTSTGRKSSLNPIRVSLMDRDDKIRSEPRVSNIGKPKVLSSNDVNSQIPRPRIRSASSDRGSIRRSNLKPPSILGKASLGSHNQLTTPITPRVSSNKPYLDLPSGPRGRSPSAERASGLNSNNSSKKDTRPLSDKNFQGQMLNRIDTFFSNAHQSSILNSNGSLRPVSLKIFVSASDFLLKFLHVKQELNSNNYMEELPKIAKKIHYPGTMAKSWLKTANTMHSWPHVLGWLSWLVEICEAKDVAFEKFQLHSLPFVDAEESEIINRNKFTKLLELYTAWNDGQVDEEEKLIKKYAQGIADDLGCNEDNKQRVEEEAEEAQKKSDEFDKQYEQILRKFEESKEKVKLLEEDELKQTAYENAQIEFSKNEELKIEKLQSDVERLDKDKDKLLKKLDDLNHCIKSQVMTVEEHDEILRKCSELQKYLHTFNEHLEELQKEVWTLDMKHSSMLDKLNSAVLAYNKDIVVNVSENADQFTLPRTSLIDFKVIDEFKPKGEAIKYLNESMKKQINEYKSMINSHNNQLESLQEKKKIMEQEKDERLSKNDERKVLIKNIKLRAKMDEAKLRDLNKKFEDEIKVIKESIPDIEVESNELQEAQEKYEAVERRRLFIELSAERFFYRIYEMFANDKNDFYKIIDKIRGL
ncbi:kinetochore protein NDC80 homolog [Microplitis demolitor]|uniref:kinetochore protein NDC80 homolog n=1 Tax=Microplitis demolitor TaxID=69319 RepID=UPI0004CCEA99|nr:kinetochore protein NDC80 homolog [Microplitis demolitor]